jgi:hypothetical protein
LADADLVALLEIEDEKDRLDYVARHIEKEYLSGDYAAQTDKSWDALHRLLADGYLTWDGGEYPLNHVVLAGRLLYSDTDYIMSLKTPDQVKDIASALAMLSFDEFRERYFSIPANDYDVDLSEEDFDYTWHWFDGVRKLYARAASESRHVLFTADQ